MTVYSVNAVFRCENPLLVKLEEYLEESIRNDEDQYLLFEYYFSKSNVSGAYINSKLQCIEVDLIRVIIRTFLV